MLFFILSAVILPKTVVSVTPKISFISGPDVIADLGGDVEMECRVENGKEYPINWIKIRGNRGRDYEYMPLSTGKMMVVKDPRIDLKYDSGTSAYTLKISDIQDFDAAQYQCQVIVGINNKISKEVNLKIRLPAEILSNSTDGAEEVTATTGEPVEIHCPTAGFPKPSVTWTRVDGGLMLDTGDTEIQGDTLRIASVVSADRGVYRCTASNGVGDPVSQDYMLKVRFAPTISVPRPRIHQALSHGVTLVCNIEAFPAPVITWSKNGENIVNDDLHTVVHFYKGFTTTSTTVKIPRLTRSSYGTYECKATNVHGVASQNLELITTKVPIPEAVYGSGVGELGTSLVLLLASIILS